MTVRATVKAVAYRTGALDAYHARRNAATLTGLMFHRVLPKAEAAACGADPLYTVTPEFLGDCVEFLRRHYTIVGLQDVIRSLNRTAPLPPAAALITFDDGWYDNLRFAAPVLKGVPWVVFVSTDAIQHPDCWWQEALLWALRSGIATEDQLWRLCGATPQADNEISHALLMAYSRLPSEARDKALAPYRNMLAGKYANPMMLSPDNVVALRNAGADIGAHGASHMPLSLLSTGEIEADMRRAQELVGKWSDANAAPAMSLPHGGYKDDVGDIARTLGYSAVFSSQGVLNSSPGGWRDGNLLGRIAVDMHDVADKAGKLDPSLLATWLFLRDIRPSAKGR